MSTLPDELETQLIEIAEDIENVIKDAQESSAANDVFTEQIANNLTFYGKSLALWEDELGVFIPEERISSEDLRKLYAQLANKIQVANHYYVESSTASAISGNGISIKKADLITALVTYYHSNTLKLPPQAILERMADGYIKKLTSINSLAEIVKDFWKEKVKTLDKVSSRLDKIAIVTATELKYTGGD